MRVKTVDKQLSVGFSKEALSQIKKLSDDGDISLAEWVRRVVYKELYSLNSPNSPDIDKDKGNF